jgi:hypothetical protein
MNSPYTKFYGKVRTVSTNTPPKVIGYMQNPRNYLSPFLTSFVFSVPYIYLWGGWYNLIMNQQKYILKVIENYGQIFRSHFNAV